MDLIFSAHQSRRVDEIAIHQYGIPGIVLMENAGRGCVELLLAQSPRGTITILAGKGNNAGDGFVIARHLHNRGCTVQLILLCDPAELRGDAAINWRIVAAMQIPYQQVTTAAAVAQLPLSGGSSDWIVDALLGTGLNGAVREPYAGLIGRMNELRSNAKRPRILAVDLPSGLDADSGSVCGVCLQADITATFATLKTGLLTGSGPSLAGTVHIVDIGVPRAVLNQVQQEEPKS